MLIMLFKIIFYYIFLLKRMSSFIQFLLYCSYKANKLSGTSYKQTLITEKSIISQYLITFY